MSGAGVASRTTESLPAAAELPVRLYMRALRQYQKLLDLRRLSSKDKVSIVLVNFIDFISIDLYNTLDGSLQFPK